MTQVKLPEIRSIENDFKLLELTQLKPIKLRFEPAELLLQFKRLRHKYTPKEDWLKPIANSISVINKDEIAILQDLFTELSNYTLIEKLVIGYVGNFLELGCELTILITPKEAQTLLG